MRPAPPNNNRLDSPAQVIVGGVARLLYPLSVIWCCTRVAPAWYPHWHADGVPLFVSAKHRLWYVWLPSRSGKYVIHFGYKGQQLEQQLQNQQQAQQEAAAAAAAAAAAQQPQQPQPGQPAPPQAQAQAQPPAGSAGSATPGVAAGGGATAALATSPPPAAAGAATPPPVTLMAQARTDVAVIPVVGGNQLVSGTSDVRYVCVCVCSARWGLEKRG